MCGGRRKGACTDYAPSPDFDVWIDDIRFYTCAADACLPTCTGDTPVSCAASGGRPAGCWPSGTDCSSPPDLVNTGIWGTGPADVWMVGQSTISWAGAISHWDGLAWTKTPSVHPPLWVNLAVFRKRLAQSHPDHHQVARHGPLQPDERGLALAADQLL